MFDLDTYIISDTHFHHNNIIRYCNRPARHDSIMVDNWNSIVKNDDVVLHLGDIAFATQKHGIPWLRGNKYFIRGNHDHSHTVKTLKSQGWKEVKPFIQKFGEGMRIYFTHYPTDERFNEWDLNIHGHIHNNGYGEFSPCQNMNVSIEVMDYRPWKLGDILERRHLK